MTLTAGARVRKSANDAGASQASRSDLAVPEAIAMVQALNASMRAESTFFQATEYLKAGVGAEEAGRPVQSALMFLMAAGRIANVLANPQETEPIRKQKAALSDKLPAIDQHLVVVGGEFVSNLASIVQFV